MPSPADVLAPGGSTVCSATYVLTQADVDAGTIENVADVSGAGPDGTIATDTDTQITSIPANPQISLVKATTATLDAVGQSIPYTFEVTNAGNVTLSSLSISDPLIASVVCPVQVLTPTESTICSGSYTATQADVDAGSVVNTATVAAFDPNNTEVTATDTAIAFPTPSKSPMPATSRSIALASPTPSPARSSARSPSWLLPTQLRAPQLMS